MSDPKHTVTVYTAAPGTPIHKFGAPEVDSQGHPTTSPRGHMYYVTSDGRERNSWGFAPQELASVNAPGVVSRSDETSYQKPVYARTMEISKAQFDKLNEFGRAPEKFGFDLRYRDAINSSVDFTWAALNHAGLKRTQKAPWEDQRIELDGKSHLLPSRNDKDLRSIPAPVPGSPLNTEQRHPAPEMKLWQRPFSENQGEAPVVAGTSPAMPGAASIADTFERLARAAASGDDKAFSAAAQGYLQSADGQALLAAGREADQQQDAQRQREEAALVQAQSATPPRTPRL